MDTNFREGYPYTVHEATEDSTYSGSYIIDNTHSSVTFGSPIPSYMRKCAKHIITQLQPWMKDEVKDTVCNCKSISNLKKYYKNSGRVKESK